MFKKVKLFLMMTLVMLPSIAIAHPGHGSHESNSILHYFATPTHALPLVLLAGVGIYFFVRKLQKDNLKKQEVKKD